MTPNAADIVPCKFCGGRLKPVADRMAPRGFRFFRCEDCDTSNVLPTHPAGSAVTS